jgi:hypothetical protein
VTTIDPTRLVRALQLEAQPLGDGRWRVTGAVSLHTVDLNGRNGGGCDCGDATYRQTTCKHELAARLAAGDGEVLRAVRGLFMAGTARRARLLSYIKELRSEAEDAGRRGRLPAAVLYRQVAGEIDLILNSGRGPGGPVGQGRDDDEKSSSSSGKEAA